MPGVDDRIEEAVQKAQDALTALLDKVRTAAADALTDLGAKIDALSAKVDEIQTEWNERNQPTQLPADAPDTPPNQ